MLHNRFNKQIYKELCVFHLRNHKNSQIAKGIYNSMTNLCYDVKKKVGMMLVKDDKVFVTKMIDLQKSYK